MAAQEAHARMAAEAAAAASREDADDTVDAAMDPVLLGDGDLTVAVIAGGDLDTELSADISTSESGESGEGI